MALFRSTPCVNYPDRDSFVKTSVAMESSYVPTRCPATTTLTPGTVISRLICDEINASRATCFSTSAISCRRTRSGSQTAVDRLALPGRQLDLAQPLAARETEQIADRRLLDQPPDQDSVAVVLPPRARPAAGCGARGLCPGGSRQRRKHRAGSVGPRGGRGRSERSGGSPDRSTTLHR